MSNTTTVVDRVGSTPELPSQRSPLRFDLDPPRRRASGTPRWATELALVGCAIFLYFFVRGLTEAGVDDATVHAEQILRFERALGLDIELAAQQYVVDHRWLVTGANWVYMWGHWPIIIATLVWLGVSRPAGYRCLRNAMFVSGGIGLIVFALYPVAPPRLIDRPFIDTVTELSYSYRVLQPPALVNKFAAVPSLHVGWNFLVAVFVWRHARRRVIRWSGVLSPVLMTIAVVLTANHYVFDAAAGIVVAVVGLKVSDRLAATGRRERRRWCRNVGQPCTDTPPEERGSVCDLQPVLLDARAARPERQERQERTRVAPAERRRLSHGRGGRCTVMSPLPDKPV